MSSTYSNVLGLNLMGTGDQSGTWGTTTNFNEGTLLEQAIAGLVFQPFANTDITLSIVAGADAGGNTTPGAIYGTAVNPASVAVPVSARNLFISCTGTTLSTGNHLYIPALSPTSTTFTKTYFIGNATTGGPIIVAVAGSSGSTVSIPTGKTCLIGVDGVNASPLITYLPGGVVFSGPITPYSAQPGIGIVQGAALPVSELYTSSTPVNSTHNSLTIAAAGVYQFESTFAYQTTTAGISWGLNYSGGYTGGYYTVNGIIGSNSNIAYTYPAIATVQSSVTSTLFGQLPGTNSAVQLFNISGTITITSTGLFGLAFGIYSGGTGTLTVLAGSYLKLTRLT